MCRNGSHSLRLTAGVARDPSRYNAPMSQELPDDLRRQIGKRTDEVAKVIDGLVAQLDLTPEEEVSCSG